MQRRRQFLLGGPALFLGLDPLQEVLRGQSTAALSAASQKAADFWVNGMGVEPDTILRGNRPRSRASSGPRVGDYAREPFFLYYDPEEKALLPAEEISPKKMTAGGNPNVQFQMMRLRLNQDDNTHFKNYASGAIYFDFAQQSLSEQQKAQDSSTGDMIMTLASSVFSAIFPDKSAPANGKAASAAKAADASKGKSRGRAAGDTAAAAPAGSGSTVALQKAKQAQSIVLPNGTGTTAFCCFAKDKHKSAFGQFIGAIAQLGDDSSAASYMQLLSIPGIAITALGAVRKLVGNFQVQGGDQEPIIQSTPMDLAATSQALAQAQNALRLRTGDYIVIPKEHASHMKSEIGKLKVLDGFLVPKEATSFDVYDTFASSAQQVSYLSLNVRVRGQA